MLEGGVPRWGERPRRNEGTGTEHWWMYVHGAVGTGGEVVVVAAVTVGV